MSKSTYKYKYKYKCPCARPTFPRNSTPDWHLVKMENHGCEKEFIKSAKIVFVSSLVFQYVLSTYIRKGPNTFLKITDQYL